MDPTGPALFALGIHEDVQDTKKEVDQLYPGELEWLGLFLDDTMAAGTARAVKAFLEPLEERWKGKGLALVPSKSIVVPTGGHHTDLRPEDFPDMVWNEDGDFKLLGAPFGSKKECEDQMAKRVWKAEEVAKGGFAKVAYVSRTTPPALITDALSEFNFILNNTMWGNLS